MIPITVPQSLSKITPFVRRAEELDRIRLHHPECRVVAYYCRNYAAGIAFTIATTDDEMECLDKILAQIQPCGESVCGVFTKVESYKICRHFADSKFSKADAEDRLGHADKNVAKLFYASATFYEMLTQFHTNEDEEGGGEEEEGGGEGAMKEYGNEQEEENNRRLYAKHRAVQILRAIKDGRTVSPGRYKEEDDGFLIIHELYEVAPSSSSATTTTTTGEEGDTDDVTIETIAPHVTNATPEIQLLVRMLRVENNRYKTELQQQSQSQQSSQSLSHSQKIILTNKIEQLKELQQKTMDQFKEIHIKYRQVQKERDELRQEVNLYTGTATATSTTTTSQQQQQQQQKYYQTKSISELQTLESKLRTQLEHIISTKESKLKAQIEEEEEKNLCVICQVERKRMLLMPCRHLCACDTCGKMLKKCPLCRQDVKERINVYS